MMKDLFSFLSNSKSSHSVSSYQTIHSHNKCLDKGYDNGEIIACYEAAMKEKLYDKVKVHTTDGGVEEQRAYACTDPMEYFAELSVAFLGGTGEDKDLEFNKWFPFNRKQLKEHDPRAYKLLSKLWLEDADKNAKKSKCEVL